MPTLAEVKSYLSQLQIEVFESQRPTPPAAAAHRPVLLDTSRLRFSQLYAAAGHAYAAVPVSYSHRQALTGGRPVAVCEPILEIFQGAAEVAAVSPRRSTAC